MARLEIDRERCIGAGMCVVSAPQWFEQDDIDARVILKADVGEADIEAVREAVLVCPSGALSIVD